MATHNDTVPLHHPPPLNTQIMTPTLVVTGDAMLALLLQLADSNLHQVLVKGHGGNYPIAVPAYLALYRQRT